MIRKATLNDVQRMNELNNQPGLTYTKTDDFCEWFSGVIEEVDELVYVYENVSGIIAFIFGERLRCSGAMIWILAVDKEYQNRGIGVRLLKHYEKECKELGINWLYADGFIDTIIPEQASKLGYTYTESMYRGYFKSIE